MTIHAVPRLPPGLTERDRLLTRLEAPTPLVVLHAPAGYGKTVVLSQWATTTARAGLWVRVRDGGGEPASFAQHLASELDDAGLLDDENPLRTAAESLSGSTDPWALLARGLRRLGEEFTLVLDESELLYDETIDGLVRLLADLPGLSIRAATRRASGLTKSTIALSFDLDLIDTATLALTAGEAASILDEDIEAEVVSHVIDNGAAPALARIVVLAGRQTPSVPPGAGPGGNVLETAVDALLWQRAQAWDPAFTTFLEVLSLSEVVDESFAAELTGAPDADGWLDRAEREGLGYWSARTLRSEPLFVFSPVFRRIVERSARARLPKARQRELDLRIARWNLMADRPFPALRGAVLCHDWQLVTDVLREHWFDLFRSSAQVRELFRGIPSLTLRSYPLISMFLAILYNAAGVHRLRAIEYFALAAYGARTQRAGSRPADRALLAMIESVASRLAGRTEASARAAASCVELLHDMSPAERDRLGRNEATAYNQAGLSLYYAGRTAEAMDCFRRSVAVGEERGLLAGLQGLAQLSGALAIAGELPDAADAVAAASARRWPDSWRDGYAGSLYQLAQTLLALEADDPETAATHLATLDRHRSTIEHWVLLEYADVLIRLLHGQAESAAVHLERSEQEHRARRLSPENHDQLRALRALVAVAAGDTGAGERAIAKMTPGPRRAIARARVDIARGDAPQALRSLASSSVDSASVRVRAEHLALTAAALALTSHTPVERDSARGALRRLHALLDDRTMRLPLVLVPVEGLDALQQLADEGDVPAGVSEMIRSARARAAIGMQRAAPSLSQRELAVARELARVDTVAQIAASLSVSPNTVKSQLRAIYRKLGVSTREEALRALSATGITEGSTPVR